MPTPTKHTRLPIRVAMAYAKETKGTYVFNAVADNAAVPTLYVRKSYLPNGAPESITLVIEV